MKELTKRELKGFKENYYLTVGQIKEFIEKHNIPDDALVLTQRVEDEYFEGGIDISGMRGADSETGIWPEGSRSGEWGVYLKESDQGEQQYSPAWCCVKYRDEEDLLFINLHY